MFDSIVNPISLIAPSTTVVNEPSFFESGYFALFALIALIALGIFLAHIISKSLRVPEWRSRLGWMIVPLLIAGLMIAKGWPPRFGVDLRGGINMVGSLNLAALEDEGNDNMERPKASDIIPNLIRRVNPSGTKEIMIRPLGDDKIEVTIPSASMQEAEDVWDRLVSAGKLQFRIVADTRYHLPEIELARATAAQGERSTVVRDEDGKQVAEWVTLARETPTAEQQEDGELMPIKFIPGSGHIIRDKTTGRIVDLSTVRLPRPKKEGIDLARFFQSQNIRTPQILMVYPMEDENVEGRHLSGVSRGVDEKGLPCVNFKTTAEGSDRLGTLTNVNKPNGKNVRLLGIVLDDKLHSAPSINGVIYSNGQISGQFTEAEIDDLIINLRSGKIDVALNKAPISRDFVESLLGQELRDKGFWAIGISLALVLVFMVIYYRFAGIVAAMALVLNLVLILAVVIAIKQPLTLTGLAGLVLTVGMAVDANVLIFERIREELDRGSALRLAIRNGFDKATTTIVDANVTTLITAIVLYWIGTEQIKGFAVTLFLGIVISMFTAIFCSRLLFDISERKRWLTKLTMGRILDRKNWDFLSKIPITAVASALLIGLGLFGIFSLGPKILNHDLRGGSTVRMVFNEPQDIDSIRTLLAEKNYKVKDEEIEFTVTGFSSQLGDENSENRVFKVDSNLPAWEGGDEEEKWMQLDELMTEYFGDKLKRHNVKVTSGAGAGAGDTSSVTPQRGEIRNGTHSATEHRRCRNASQPKRQDVLERGSRHRIGLWIKRSPGRTGRYGRCDRRRVCDSGRSRSGYRSID